MSENASEPSFRRFRGALVWLGSESDWRSTDQVERAILRPDELVVDVTVGGQRYEAALRRQANGLYVGAWHRISDQRQASGKAKCTLAPWVPSPSGASASLRLEGRWWEDGLEWDWHGRLDEVQSFTQS